MSTTVLEPTLEAACERWSDRPALTHHGRTLTYATLWQRVLSLAGAYAGMGVSAGHRVAIQLPPCPEYLIAVHAAWACGAVHVGAPKDLTPPELSALAVRTEASAVVVQPPPGGHDAVDYVHAVGRAWPGATVVVHCDQPAGGAPLLDELLAGPPARHSPAGPPTGGREPETTALLFLTSGTTGRPKAVMETLPALRAKMQFFADAIRPGPDDVHLMFLSISHAFGLKLSLTALASGGRLVMLDRFSPEAALDLARQERVSVLPGTPAHFAMLLRAMRADRTTPETDRLDALRLAVAAAAPFPHRLLEGLYRTLGVELFYVYGCSEGFLTATSDRDDLLRGSVGRNVFKGPSGTPPDGTVAVFDPDHHSPLPAGSIGQIVYGAREPVRFWEEPPAATDGWYRTGDLGWMDGDGRLFVAGRINDVINRGGMKVAPGEVEAVLIRHPGLDDCAVVPTPDAVLGEAICACVVAADASPLDLSDVRGFLGRFLARHKLPDELCVLESIPRTQAGKLDREALVDLVVNGSPARQRLRPDEQG